MLGWAGRLVVPSFPPLLPPSLCKLPMSRIAVPKLGKTALLVCDIQEVFRPIIHGMSSLIKTSEFLVSTAAQLDLPIVVTEQYPKAMKSTVTELSSIWIKADAARAEQAATSGVTFLPTPVFEKTQFSMCTEPFVSHLQVLGVDSAIICGIESHICVMQTALDLMERGMQVYIPVDSVSSTRSFDRTVALRRLEASGAVMTTSESVIFQLLRDSKHPKFRTVSGMIKEHGQMSKTHELSHL